MSGKFSCQTILSYALAIKTPPAVTITLPAAIFIFLFELLLLKSFFAPLALYAYRDIGDVLATLPEEFRQAVVLSDVADLDYPTIATLLEIPVGTVKSRVARGRTMLRERIGNHGDGGRRRMGEE